MTIQQRRNVTLRNVEMPDLKGAASMRAEAPGHA